MFSVPLELPNEPVALGSPFYIERPPIEQLIYQEITNPGCLIRIKAPSKMGKTSLLLRVINYAQHQNYRTIYLDFQQADEETFTCLDKFLRWFCANVTRQLKLTSMLEEYWDKDIGYKVSCTIYFEDYILPNIDNPIVLTINEVNRLFEHPEIARDFLSLLRSWHEEAKHNDIFQKLRLVISHSTEIYITLNINQSPFNVGIAIQLPEFTTEQIQHLAQLHGLDWTVETAKVQSLQKMLGGHPYLVRLAIYNLVKYPQLNLEQLLHEAPTLTGIFSDYLRNLLANVQNNQSLRTALKKVIARGDDVELEHIIAYKLESMGMVKLNGNKCRISCDLYRQYFASQNWDDLSLQDKLVQLQQENLKLRQLSITDDLTKLVNRSYFDTYLEENWQALAEEAVPVSLILCEIDYFRIYSESQGKEAANYCLQQVSRVIENWVKRPSLIYSRLGIVARYDYQQFAIILPRRNAFIAFKLAERIRKEVKKLGILHNSNYDGFNSRVITISLGVACTIPQPQDSPNILVNAANQALNQSKRIESDRTYVSSDLNYGLGNRGTEGGTDTRRMTNE
ncbi:MAG: AAA-like domain-containing protein [Nostocaceae cyanobacterium]|nr:AAA-like domain-containing protein [Nostocaceae cyanobacterium]